MTNDLFEQQLESPACFFGYIRVSTVEQSTERQRALINEKFPNKINAFYTDTSSGKNLVRPGLNELLKMVRRNDTIVTESFSRISRNTFQLFHLLEELKKKEVYLISIKENFNFNSPTGRVLLSLLVSLTQMEREILLERQKEGISIARKKGMYRGRKTIKKPENFEKCLNMYLNRENNYRIKEFMQDTGLKRSVLFRLIKEEKTKKQNENI
jgi:DNA invertase Pin-like site-specific DNA recombinase